MTLFKEKYRWVDHTADLCLQVYGRSAEALYETAAMAMFDRITDRSRLSGNNSENVRVEGADRTDLMVNWLRELLYCWNGNENLVRSVRVDRLSSLFLEAIVAFDPFEPELHEIRTEIKAITYHRARVLRIGDAWEATLVFDV